MYLYKYRYINRNKHERTHRRRKPRQHDEKQGRGAVKGVLCSLCLLLVSYAQTPL